MSTQTPPGGAMPPSGPPYLPRGAQLGGSPTTTLDVPLSAVCILLFVMGAAFNMTIFQINKRRGHKFILSGVTFGFCMARITANVLRIVWACYPTDVDIAIATSVFTNAGVLLLFVINLIFLQRILRAYHPKLGWSKPMSWVFKFLYVSIVAALIMLISSVVYGFYTLNPNTQQILRKVRLTASVWNSLIAFIPIPATIAIVLTKPKGSALDKFGRGRMRTKVRLILLGSFLLSLGAWFRTSIGFVTRPLDNPGWWNHKACFYCFNFLIEIIVVYCYALSRMDRRFHIPNGARGHGSYSRRPTEDNAVSSRDEETLAGDTPGDAPPTDEAEEAAREQEWEKNAKKELAQQP